MSKLSTKFIIVILAAGILIGAATTTTVIGAGIKPSNFALAQLRFPFQTQPRVQAPLQQQQRPLTTTSTSGGGSFGPSCARCVTTQNLANGAVTTPKIVPGAVSISTTHVVSQPVNIAPESTGGAHLECPSGTVVTGGGYNSNIGTIVFGSLMNDINGWVVNAFNPSSTDTIQVVASATCATVHP
jgi:hypothetical protein